VTFWEKAERSSGQGNETSFLREEGGTKSEVFVLIRIKRGEEAAFSFNAEKRLRDEFYAKEPLSSLYVEEKRGMKGNLLLFSGTAKERGKKGGTISSLAIESREKRRKSYNISMGERRSFLILVQKAELHLFSILRIIMEKRGGGNADRVLGRKYRRLASRTLLVMGDHCREDPTPTGCGEGEKRGKARLWSREKKRECFLFPLSALGRSENQPR